MLRRYELTDEEWLRIEPLLPPENTGKQGRPRKDNRIIMNGIVWLDSHIYHFPKLSSLHYKKIAFSLILPP